MNQLSSHISEQIAHNHKNNIDDQILSVGPVTTLKRAMTVKTMSEMLDCFKDMKSYAKTIEKELSSYFKSVSIDRRESMMINELNTDDFIELAKQRLKNNRYIILHDLIEQKKKSKNECEHKNSKIPTHKKSAVEQQVDYMKRVINAQPSALEALYLEALLNPDQWQYNHQLLQTSPMDNLTSSERKRLNKILNENDRHL